MAMRAVEASAPARSNTVKRREGSRVERVDQLLAWVSTLGPLTGTVAAVWLHFHGLPAGGVDLALLAGLYLVTTAGLEVGYHRYFSHYAFETNDAVKAALGIAGSMALQGPVIWWAATHRRHHGYTDTQDDPHSPIPRGEGRLARLRGMFHAHWGWLFDAQKTRPAGWAEAARDLYRDPVVFRVHMRYLWWVALGLALPAALGGLLTASVEGALTGLLWGGFVRMFLTDHSIRSVNSLAHTFGSRPFRTNDRSTNNAWIALPSFGGAWHNNHHAFPRSASTSLAWWQIDLAGLTIRALERLGLAWNVKTTSPAAAAARRAG